MRIIDALAADYWIENTEHIYAEDLHISGPVMDAYKAGFLEARKLAVSEVELYKNSFFDSDLIFALENLGEGDDNLVVE